MNTNTPTNPKDIKNKLQKLASKVIGYTIVVVVLIVILKLMINEDKKLKEPKKNVDETNQRFNPGLSNVLTVEEDWATRESSKIELQESQIKENELKINELNEKLDKLMKEKEFRNEEKNQPTRTKFINEKWDSNTKNKENIKTHIIENSFVKVFMINGSDITAGVNPEEDTQPILFKVVGNIHYPNKIRSERMKGCFLSASVKGDISTERGFLRLERGTCVKKDGSIVRAKIKGYIAGEDAKNGLGGKLFSNKDEHIYKAAIASGIANIGDAIANASVPQPLTLNLFDGVDIDKRKIKNRSRDSNMKYGAVKGTLSGIDEWVKYMIEEAKLRKSYIELLAGREATAVFTETVPFELE